ncbi:DUF2577 domain-containing protein [Lachnospiraceae bacterium OttesenSCG-928-D06]|nr:DUF2577 domain-containing protein [Lachnospiraceae bacterium OttesenSCG-928-D06]
MNLLPDAVELVKTMKKAALDAMESSKPVAVYFGEVQSVSPLKINVEQKMILGEAQLILSRNVTDFKTMVTVDWVSESSLKTHSHELQNNTADGGDPTHNHSLSGNTKSTSLSHTHNITGKKQITVHNALVVGDKVVILRQQEGQKFIVWDRVGG